MPAPHQVQLRPVPHTAGSCPHCSVPLRVERLRFPGWRTVVEGRCGRCGHLCVQDLPSGHGFFYPVTLDLDTGETIELSGASWFARPLRRDWDDPCPDPVEMEVEVRHPAQDVVLLNCLDPIFGHALLKLLNVQRLLPQGDVVVLAPAAIRQLVPEEVAEVWTVHAPLAQLNAWLIDLERKIEGELDRFERCTLAAAIPQPHPSTYDLDALVDRFEPERLGPTQISLSIRDDRPWGASPKRQDENIGRLVRRLRLSWPRATFVALGVGAGAAMPEGVLDLRSPHPDAALERRWISLLRATDLAIGVHGSNMLLPSGLAGVTIELAPRARWGNVPQATIPDRDPVLALARHRVIYGADDLDDVIPEHVADIAVAAVGERPRIEALMAEDASPAAAAAAPPSPVLPPSPHGLSAGWRPLREALARARAAFGRRRGS